MARPRHQHRARLRPHRIPPTLSATEPGLLPHCRSVRKSSKVQHPGTTERKQQISNKPPYGWFEIWSLELLWTLELGISCSISELPHFPCYKCEPPPSNRTRRKFIRFDTGNASRRRIKSNSARSVSLRKAAKAASCFRLRFVLFTQRLLQNLQHGLVSRSAGSAFARDDIRQTRNPQAAPAELDFFSARPQAIE